MAITWELAMSSLVGVWKVLEARAFDDASRRELVAEQVRKVRFDGPDRITVTPTSGVRGYNDINVIWERVG